MAQTERPKRAMPQRPSSVTVHTRTQRLIDELDRYLKGSPEQRDTLLREGGEQLTYLASILAAFLQSAQERETRLKELRKALRKQDAPGPGITRAALLTLQLIQALVPHIDRAGQARRDRIMNLAGRELDKAHQVIATLTASDPQVREELVKRTVAGTRPPSQDVILAMKAIYKYPLRRCG